MANPLQLPSGLSAQTYPDSSSFTFPEFSRKRFNPSSHPLGICFSGGGPRSFSASLGQMRGLVARGLLDKAGAISCVSGGTWFGSMATFANSSISDSTLLGMPVDPASITVSGLSQMPDDYLGKPLPGMTNETIGLVLGALLALYKLGLVPMDRVYSQGLNQLLLSHFNLDSLTTYFTLDSTSLQEILQNNGSLTASNFFLQRPGRPYFIAGSTQVYPTGAKQELRHFEYSSLYSGRLPLESGVGPAGQDFGGGFVDSFAFDSQTPSAPDSAGRVTVNRPQPQFLLSDVMGSSGAAPGAFLDQLDSPGYFPQFNYWPMVKVGQEASTLYSFTDGGNLEDVGIVPLLRRQYPVILACVNAELPIGTTSSQAVDGISGQISRLFGRNPAQNNGNGQNTQIFPRAQFDTLATALKNAKANGDATFHVDTYTIEQPNSFDLAPYPGNGKVTVIWLYNDINGKWKSKLQQPVQQLLTSTDPQNYLANFPNYGTVFQNKDSWGIPEILMLTAQQVNLLAHMQSYNIQTDVGNAVSQALGSSPAGAEA